MRRPLVAGNWKMFGTQTSSKQLLESLLQQHNLFSAIEIVVFPPFVFLNLCRDLLSKSQIKFGAQTVSMHDNGAYTGEVSANMLKDLSCTYVLVGHSERRQYFSENNETLLAQATRVCDAGMTPILCVGETLQQREAGKTLNVVYEQLEVVARLKDNCPGFKRVVIAYEPVWAIGTGRVATPEVAESVHLAIRDWLHKMDSRMAAETRILYGGSVKPDNASALFSMPNIDGALVGGASLNAADFTKIGVLCSQSF